MPSRVGEILTVEEPVIVTFERPWEKVLFSETRDANPFFHLFEALWMLAGRNDVAPLKYYNSKIGDVASDDGKTFHGCYGYRWRHWFGYDQLEWIVHELRMNPWSRRYVLSHWDACSCQGMTGKRDDLHKAVVDNGKDVPCNFSVTFRVLQGPCPKCNGKGYKDSPLGSEAQSIACESCHGTPSDSPCYLSMSVHNRSNDLVWGMLGANVVHFAFLQEYVAARCGLKVGPYHQITDNLHCYTSRWYPDAWLGEYREKRLCAACFTKAAGKEPCTRSFICPNNGPCDDCRGNAGTSRYPFRPRVDLYDCTSIVPLSLLSGEDARRFDTEVKRFIDDPEGVYEEPFLATVAAPMCLAFRHHKERDYVKALEAVERTASDDWKIAGRNWLLKREKYWSTRYARSPKQELSAE